LTAMNGVTNILGVDFVTGQVTPLLQLDAPPRTYQGLHTLHKAQISTAYIANSIAAVNKAAGLLYLLKANNVEDVPNILLTVDLNNRTLVSQTVITGLSAPISGFHYDPVGGSLVAFGLRNVTANWLYYAGRINLNTGLFTESVASQANVAPYVDFSWSDYEPTSSTIFILSRHEDEPTTLMAQLFTINIGASTITSVNVTLDRIFSSFAIDSTTPNTLLAFSPGAVNPDDGDVAKPFWQIVQINTARGSISSGLPAPPTMNQYPVWWGGGSFGFSNSKAATTASTQYYNFFVPNNYTRYPEPSQIQAVIYSLSNNTISIPNYRLPYMFNLISVT